VAILFDRLSSLLNKVNIYSPARMEHFILPLFVKGGGDLSHSSLPVSQPLWVYKNPEVNAPAGGRWETIQTMRPFISYTQSNKLLW